jgi:AmmeMemoRadiSam system protein B
MSDLLSNKELLQKAISILAPVEGPEPVKLLFVPPHVTEGNRHQFVQTYSHIYGLKYEVVVVVEDVDRVLEKRISMPNFETFESIFGPVKAHDSVRNEFADEDDDLYVDNGGVHSNMAISHQLPFLQAALGDFQVVSVQLYDQERPSIIKELAYVIEEILGERSALIVLCCDLASDRKSDLARLQEYVANSDMSNIFNVLNSGVIPMKGHGPFITGILVIESWNLSVQFNPVDNHDGSQSLISGKASMQMRTQTA